MSGILKLLKLINRIDSSVKKIIPITFSFVITIIQIITAIIESVKNLDAKILIQTLAKTIAAADYNIYTQVNVGLNTPEKFGISNIIIIFSSLIFLWLLIRTIQKGISFLFTNASISEGLGTALVAVVILGLLEVVAVVTVFGKWIFPGIGVISLVINLPVLINVYSTNLASLKEFLYNTI